MINCLTEASDMATELLALRPRVEQLEAALRDARRYIPGTVANVPVQNRIGAALAQPAESGATKEVAQTDPPSAGMFRKKPVVISARQASEAELIETLEGTMRADPGDWIIMGVKGERYPCKPDIFEATYEPASAPREQSASSDEVAAWAIIAARHQNEDLRIGTRHARDLQEMRAIAAALSHARAEGKAEGMEVAARLMDGASDDCDRIGNKRRADAFSHASQIIRAKAKP